MKTRQIFFFVLILTSLYWSMSSYSDEIPVMDEVIISAGEDGTLLSGYSNVKRVIDKSEIKRLNIDSINEALNLLPSLKMTEPASPGAQADISINGSSFENILILVNGIKVSDPQTGHFIMDIPVDISSVEKIEILSGGGTIYGSSSAAGIINIVTGAENGVFGSVSAGSHDSFDTKINLSKKIVGKSASISFRTGKSDGYRKSTELNYYGFDSSGSFEKSGWSTKWNLGALKKDFGIGGFYAPYPSFEKTLTIEGGINVAKIINNNSMLRFKTGSRGHADDYILIKNNPGFYQNTHYNRSYIFSTEYFTTFTNFSSFLFGLSSEIAGITSGTLGNHKDINNSAYSYLKTKVIKPEISFSMRYDSGFRNENIFSPGFNISLPLINNSTLKLNAEKSFRSPTYTELYYRSPVNQADSLLKSERNYSLNADYDFKIKDSEVRISFFNRKSINVIDWVKYLQENVWKSVNQGVILTNGGEIYTRKNFFNNLVDAELGASILNQSVKRKKGTESKYALNPLGKTFTVSLNGKMPYKSDIALTTRYEEVLHGEKRMPVTVKFSKSYGMYKAIISVTNIFNEKYHEIPDIVAPGRWFTIRLEYLR